MPGQEDREGLTNITIEITYQGITVADTFSNKEIEEIMKPDYPVCNIVLDLINEIERIKALN